MAYPNRPLYKDASTDPIYDDYHFPPLKPIGWKVEVKEGEKKKKLNTVQKKLKIVADYKARVLAERELEAARAAMPEVAHNIYAPLTAHPPSSSTTNTAVVAAPSSSSTTTTNASRRARAEKEVAAEKKMVKEMRGASLVEKKSKNRLRWEATKQIEKEKAAAKEKRERAAALSGGVAGLGLEGEEEKK